MHSKSLFRIINEDNKQLHEAKKTGKVVTTNFIRKTELTSLLMTVIVYFTYSFTKYDYIQIQLEYY